MLLFAHTGITLGVAYGFDKFISKSAGSFARTDRPGITSKLKFFAGKIDYRIVLLGSMLPDIIDKPLGIYLFGNTFDNGRIFTHTIVFLLVLFLIGLYRFRRYAKTGFLVLLFGCTMHLILDEMWNNPHTLFWPLDGISFPDEDIEDFTGMIWESMTTRPKSYITEIIGLSILIPIGLRLIKRHRVMRFLKRGVIE